MAILPQSIVGRIEFLESRLAKWSLDPAGIGLDLPSITALQTATENARTALTEQGAAHAAARASTLNLHNVADVMDNLASDAIRAIKLHASQTNDPNVYVLANIPAPQPPTPAGPPKAPTELVADPNADGTVTLRWKGSVANHTFFSLQRKLDSGPWMPLGAMAVKTFLDTTIPTPPPTAVLYRVFSQRQNLVSEPSMLAGVSYGSGDGGVAMTNIAGFVGGDEVKSEAA